MTYMTIRVPADQLTKNFTNLYLKGVIGVQAMAEISRSLGNAIDAEAYDVSILSFKFSG